MFKVGIISKKICNTNNSKIAFLQLPATEIEIGKAFKTAEISDSIDCDIVSINNNSSFFDEKLMSIEFGENSLNELNFLAYQLQGLTPADTDIYHGMVAIENPSSLKDLINLTANLDNIHYVPDVTNAEQLGEFLVENDFVEIPEEYLKYVDYSKIGRERLDDFPSTLTRTGYVEDGRNKESLIEIYDGVHLPEIKLHEQNQEQEGSTGMKIEGM